MALTPSKSHVTASTVNQAVTKANKNKSTNQHKEAARLARKAAKMATEQGDYHLANHYHRIYEHHSQLANIRKSETKDNPTNMDNDFDPKNPFKDGASEHIPTHLKQLQSKADAYHKAGDIESANALRNKIKIIKTKHGMAPVFTTAADIASIKRDRENFINAAKKDQSTQKAEEKKPFEGLKHGYVKPKFNMGDKVRSIHNPNIIGEVSYNMASPVEGVKKYKVTEPNGRRQHWDEDSMVKISDEEHAKGTPYYNKPTEKSETRLSILAKGVQAAITLRGLVKAEILNKSHIFRLSSLSPENRLKYAQKKASDITDTANTSNNPEYHANAAFWHRNNTSIDTTSCGGSCLNIGAKSISARGCNVARQAGDVCECGICGFCKRA